MEALERLVFLDTETTGLDPKSGHRIIEVAGVEAVGRRLTGQFVHFYLNPEREIDAGATAVHGFTWENLRNKPKFSAIADELLAFLENSRVVIHNAPFDVAFLDHELTRLRKLPVAKQAFEVTDSLALARELHPGKRNSLDALCERLGVDNTHRNLHGALLDARLLGEVYLALTRGQSSLEMLSNDSHNDGNPSRANHSITDIPIHEIELTEAYCQMHQAYLLKLGEKLPNGVLWRESELK